MPRINRVDVAYLNYYVINRANARMQIFETEEDCVNKSRPLGDEGWCN